MVSGRRGRLWFPFSSGTAPQTLTVLTAARFFIPTIAEVEQERQFARYTTMRLVYNLEARGNTNDSVLTVGLIMLPEGSGVATHAPAAQPTGSWLYHEEFLVKTAADNQPNRVSRDLTVKRISRGLNNELHFYLQERSNLTNVTYHVSGRVLVLEA